MKKMKQSINFVSSIILALALNACSSDMDNSEDFGFDKILATYQNVCPSETDAVMYSENVDANGTFVIPDETIRSMSTCGLLVTYLNNPVFLPETISNMYAPSVTIFNHRLREKKVAVELFTRGDFFPVLASKYLSIIKVTEYDGHSLVSSNGQFNLQWLLASDMCMSAMSEKEKIQLMAMALERTKYAIGIENMYPCLIMIAIMKSCKYAPFMEDIEPRLGEVLCGYAMREPDGTIPLHALNSHERDIIIKYAKQFLNEQKI